MENIFAIKLKLKHLIGKRKKKTTASNQASLCYCTRCNIQHNIKSSRCLQAYRHLFYDSRVTEVQVWLFFEELMEIALLSHLIILPGGIPEDTHLTNKKNVILYSTTGVYNEFHSISIMTNK